MSSIKLKGSSSGDVTITVPAAAGTNTVTIPALTGNLPLSNLTHVTNRPNLKPIFINGAMEIWQRGTALASSSGNYASDRFWYAGTGMTSQRNTDAPSGFSYSNKLTYGSADMAIGQAIELPATGKQGMFIAGQKFTIAFYGKVDSGTEAVTVAPSFRNAKFSGTNLVSFSPATSSVTLTTDWQRFVTSFTIPTVNANNTQILFEIKDIAKTAYITGVQAEIGEFDTTTTPPFQHDTLIDNQNRCSRYFQKLVSSNNQGIGEGFSSDGTGRGATMVPFLPMRASPTVTTSAASTFKFQQGVTTSSNGTSFIVASVNNNQGANQGQAYGVGLFRVHIDVAAAGMAQDGRFCRGVSNGDSFVQVEAEL